MMMMNFLILINLIIIIVNNRNYCDALNSDSRSRNDEYNEVIDHRLKSVISSQLPKQAKFFDEFDGCKYNILFI